MAINLSGTNSSNCRTIARESLSTRRIKPLNEPLKNILRAWDNIWISPKFFCREKTSHNSKWNDVDTVSREISTQYFIGQIFSMFSLTRTHRSDHYIDARILDNRFE